jgi:hypothetical protein
MTETKQISMAFVKAQKEFGPALKTHTNPAFKSKYADLSACVEAVVDALNNNGIGLMQRTIQVESGVCVETVFVHESGETLSSGPLHVPASKQDPQGYGSALTYARRYSLMAACGIAPEDDDGNAGSPAGAADRNRPAPAPAAAPARLSPERVADWLAAIKDAGDDEIDGVMERAHAAARKVQDKRAFNQMNNALAARKVSA